MRGGGAQIARRTAAAALLSAAIPPTVSQVCCLISVVNVMLDWCLVHGLLGQAVSLLLDLCRQSIIFEDIDDLCLCITAITDDSDVVVVQVAIDVSSLFEGASSQRHV